MGGCANIYHTDIHHADERRAVAQLDRAWGEAYQARDLAALTRILADDWVAFAAPGEVITKRVLLARLPTYPEATLHFDDVEVYLYGDTAVTRDRLTITTNSSSERQRFVRVYAKRQGEWRAVVAQVIP